MWVNRPGRVVYKCAFVTLGHNSLPSTCSDVGHKGIVQSVPVGPASLSCLAAPRKPDASSCWLPACRFPHMYQDVGVSGTSGTDRRKGWHSLDSRLGQGDTLVVVSIGRFRRRWLDTMCQWSA